MIDINDYNREDLIASCLMEAANVMSESSSTGANNVQSRLYRARKSNQEELLDKYRKELSDRVKNSKKIGDKKSADFYASQSRKFGRGEDDSAVNMAKFLKQKYGLDNYDRSDRKSSEIHDKINRRARKAMGESAYDHLDFADAVLDILDDYDY